jgi:hypothetical protein
LSLPVVNIANIEGFDRFWAVRTLSIYKGGFARRPVRGTAANSPTTDAAPRGIPR